jgi:hypothetical protein
MFSKDPFNIAPEASGGSASGWLALVVGACLSAIAVVALADSTMRLQKANELVDQLKVTLDSSRASKAVPLKAGEDQKARQVLSRLLRLSWTSLFDALESAGRAMSGRVSLVAIAPVTTKTGIVQVDVTALAVSTPHMLSYLHTLEASPQVRQVLLSTQQPTTTAGVPTVRFQFSLMWDAGDGVPAPVARGRR